MTGGLRDSQVSGNRQHRTSDDHSARLMQYLSIGKFLAGLNVFACC